MRPTLPCGHDLDVSGCRICHLNATNPNYTRLFLELAGHPVGPKPIAATIVRKVRCEFLIGREEFRVGCGGMNCRHACSKGLPAIPGQYCQTCPTYSADPAAADDFEAHGVPNWTG